MLTPGFGKAPNIRVDGFVGSCIPYVCGYLLLRRQDSHEVTAISGDLGKRSRKVNIL